jgi:hypothetical protein
MTRLTMLFVVAALVIPGAAFASPAQDPGGTQPQTAQNLTAPDRDARTRAVLNNGVDAAAQDAKWRAIEAYYASYAKPKPIVAVEPAPVADDHTGPSWFGAFGIGAALMLLAGGLGVYAGRSLRPRHLGA